MSVSDTSFGVHASLHDILKISADYQSTHRVSSIPPLGTEAIEFLIDEHIYNHRKHKDKYQGLFDWDDVRRALRKKGDGDEQDR